MRTLAAAAAGACALVLAGAGCGGEEERPPPGAEEGQAIVEAAGRVVVQCRSVEAGVQESVDEEALRRDVDVLVDASERFDPDATIRLPPLLLEPDTTLRNQARLAAAQLVDGCAPAEGERLRDAIAD